MESIKEESNKIPKKVFKCHKDVPKDFTGACKIPNGIGNDYEIYFFKNGIYHREDGAAVIYSNGDKQWHYKGKFFGEDEEFNNETWALKVSELKSKNIIELRELSAGVI